MTGSPWPVVWATMLAASWFSSFGVLERLCMEQPCTLVSGLREKNHPAILELYHYPLTTWRLFVILALWAVMLAIQKHRRLLGEAIRAARKEAGFSQEKLAEKADLSTVFISRVERAKESPSVDNLVVTVHVAADVSRLTIRPASAGSEPTDVGCYMAYGAGARPYAAFQCFPT
ncbi:MAG: helix-turn-helix transcriptional regulator [Verrucomicrobiota bacterium]